MIKFQNVKKTYKNSGANAKEALRGVSFLIDDGEFVFVIGKSGSGKSTLLKCMNCEERPNEGTITIDGFPISGMSRALVPVLRRQVGMVFQDFRLIDTKTVAENISFAGEIIGMSRKSLHQKVQLVLNIVGLKDKADAYPQQLSGGECQRVAIARAMLNNPKIIIADEPTGNLDPETSENIMGLLLDINRSGTTVIVCTHDANMVDKMKKRVIEIEDGIVVRDQEDSAYAEEHPEGGAPLPQLNVAFGDKSPFGEDADYHAGYEDEEVYVEEKPPIGDFYFGETPPAPVLPTVPAAAPAVVPVPVPEETPFGEMITDVADLPVENEAEIPESRVDAEEEAGNDFTFGDAPVKEEPSTDEPSEKTTSEEAEIKAETEDVAAEAKAEETPSGETNTKVPEIPVSETVSETTVEAEEEVPEEDDSWLNEVRMDDIDLDIQEDDE